MDVRPGHKQTEIGVIPEDWDATPIGTMFTFKNGLNKSKEYFGYGTPIVNYMDVFNHSGLKLSDLEGRVDVNKLELKAYEVRQGDVFFTRTSETVEEIGVASVMLDAPEKTVFSGFVLRGRPVDDSLDNEFKRYCFSSRVVRQQITSRSSYTTRALTNGRSLSAVVLPTPTRVEQRAIAEALSDAGALIESLEQLIAKKRHLKQGAMQELLTGKTRLSGFSGEWVERAIEEIADVDSDNLGAGTDPDYRFHYISLEDVEKGTLLGTSEIVFRHAPSRARRRVRKGDVLFGTVRPNLQSHCIIRHDVEGHICSTGFAVIRCREGRAIPEFVFVNLFADYINHQIERLIAGSNYPAVNSGDVKALRLHSPEPEEQQAIAAILSDMDAEIAALEAKLAKSRQIKQGMMHNLLTGKIRLL